MLRSRCTIMINDQTIISPESQIIVVDLGNRCNNNCLICFNKLNSKPNQSYKEIVDYIDKEYKLGSKTIIFTGGEPTIYTELPQIILHVKSLEFETIQIISNGRMFQYPDYCKFYMGMHNLIIVTEIHNYSSKLHDQITNTSDSYEQTVKGIKNLLSLGISLQINVMMHKLNYKDLPAITEFILKELKGIKKINYRNIFYIGNAFLHRYSLFTRYSEIVPYLEKSLEQLDIAGIESGVQLFPICLLSPRYRNKCTEKIGLSQVKYNYCGQCSLMDRCPGLLKTYIVHFGYDELRPIIESGSSSNMPAMSPDTIKVKINTKLCVKCGACQSICPMNAIDINESRIDNSLCIECMNCVSVCNEKAIDKINGNINYKGIHITQ
jgi:MoaA/NifB/PqqE/SkfB family radical SAM enzyme